MEKGIVTAATKVFFILIIMFSTSVETKAQEIGIAPVKIFTDSYEMGNPVGIGFYYMQPIGHFGLRFEYVYAGRTRNYTGQLSCGFMVYPPEYEDENIKSEPSYSSAAIGLYLNKFVSLAGIDLNVGAGVSFDKFECKRTATVTGRQLTITSDKKHGYYFAVSLSGDNIFKLPLKAELQFRLKDVEGTVDATDIEQPFVDIEAVKEISLGIAYML